MGDGWWGKLYDESRRNKVLAQPAEGLAVPTVQADDWNDYRIRCEGHHIQLWLNGIQTVDYREPDETVDHRGVIAVQIHGVAVRSRADEHQNSATRLAAAISCIASAAIAVLPPAPIFWQETEARAKGARTRLLTTRVDQILQRTPRCVRKSSIRPCVPRKSVASIPAATRW